MKPERVLNNMWARIAVGGLATLSIAGIYTGRPYLERLFNPPPAASAPKGDNNKDNNVGALVLTPTVSPDGIPIITITVPDTATAVPTVEPSVTEVPPTATTVPSPTRVDTATSVPATNTPKAEVPPTTESDNILPEYEVFWGIIKDPKTGKSIEEVEVARIPTNDLSTDSYEIFVFWITTPDHPGGAIAIGAHQFKSLVTNGSHFQAGADLRNTRYDPKDNTIKGASVFSQDQNQVTLVSVGTGKDAIISTMNKITKDQAQASNKRINLEQELKIAHINPDLWP